MTKITGNEPAQPFEVSGYIGNPLGGSDINTTKKFPGLTIRQHIAAMAMQGILASGIGCTNDKDSNLTDHKSVSEASVNYADALIAELNTQQTEKL